MPDREDQGCDNHLSKTSSRPHFSPPPHCLSKTHPQNPLPDCAVYVPLKGRKTLAHQNRTNICHPLQLIVGGGSKSQRIFHDLWGGADVFATSTLRKSPSALHVSCIIAGAVVRHFASSTRAPFSNFFKHPCLTVASTCSYTLMKRIRRNNPHIDCLQAIRRSLRLR